MMWELRWDDKALAIVYVVLAFIVMGLFTIGAFSS
jgi:hypothetical protein